MDFLSKEWFAKWLQKWGNPLSEEEIRRFEDAAAKNASDVIHKKLSGVEISHMPINFISTEFSSVKAFVCAMFMLGEKYSSDEEITVIYVKPEIEGEVVTMFQLFKEKPNQYKKPKWLYRLECKDPDNGLWYNSKAEFCFEKGIGSLDDTCKTKSLPMDYDERYRQHGRMWNSSCSREEDLLHWYSKEDAKKLKEKDFVFAKYLATEYVEYEFETVFIKSTSIKRVEIDIDEFFK